MVLLKQLQRLYTSGFIFQVPPVYDYSTCCTNRVPTRSVHQPLFTRSVHQPLAYASSALMKQLLIRGRHQYIDYVICFNTKDSHHPNEHIILYVFRAPGYDSIVSLNWYEHWLVSAHRLAITRHFPPSDTRQRLPVHILVRPARRSEVRDYGLITNSVYLFKS